MKVTDGIAFFGLERIARNRWRMPVVRQLISGTGALFGGAGLGAAIEIAEAESARPAIWATAQYLNYAPEGSELILDVNEVVHGNQVSQVRVIARCDDREILTVIGAYGMRPLDTTGQWAQMPTVPPPDKCPPRPLMDQHQGTISSRMDMRLANARPMTEFPSAPGTGNSALWARFPGRPELKASGLAIIGDFVPFGISQALGMRAGGNSIDNTLRVANLVDSEWMLIDIRIHAVSNGFGHGLVHIWSEGGVLLATASQSTMVRHWKEQPPTTQEVK